MAIRGLQVVEHSFGVQNGMRAFQLEAISFSLSHFLSLALALKEREREREIEQEEHTDSKRRVFVNFTFILAGECSLTVLPPQHLKPRAK